MPTAMLSPFKPVPRPRRSRPSLKTRTSRRSRRSVSASCSRHGRRRLSELRRGQRLGSSATASRRASFIGSRLTTRSLTTRSPAGCRITKSLPDQARCRAKTASAIPIGSRSAAATDSRSLFDPTDRDMFYAESQEGYVHRINVRTGRNVASSAPSRRRVSGLSLSLELAADSPACTSRRALSRGQSCLSPHRSRRKLRRSSAPTSPTTIPRKTQRHRKRRGKFRRRLFVSRIARESRPPLGGDRRRPALGNGKRWRQLDGADPKSSRTRSRPMDRAHRAGHAGSQSRLCRDSTRIAGATIGR